MAWYTTVSTGDVLTAANWNAMAADVRNTSTGHDHDGSGSNGTLVPTTLTVSGASALSGACTLGDGDDNVTVNCGTGTLSVNANSFSVDLDTTANVNIDVSRNQASPTNSLLTLHELNSSSTADSLRIYHLGNSYALQCVNVASGSATNRVMLVGGAGDTDATTAYFYRNLASGSTAVPVVRIAQDNASDDQSALKIDDNRTAGAAGNASLTIDSESVSTAGLYITSPVDASGTGVVNDNALAVVSEGVGGSGTFYRDVDAATLPVLQVYQDHLTGATPSIEIRQDDLSEGFINFTAGADPDRGVVAAATASLKSVRVELDGTVYRLALYVDA